MQPTSLEERFSTSLHTSARAWRQALDRRMKDLGVSQSGWLAIAYIAKAEGPLSQSDLASLVSVEAATMVSTVDKLEKAGLVIRVVSESDRRVKHLKLTPDGQALYKKVRSKADAMRAELLAAVDRQKLAEVTEILEYIQNIIETF